MRMRRMATKSTKRMVDAGIGEMPCQLRGGPLRAGIAGDMVTTNHLVDF
jgi:hypothetical protein